MGKITCFALGLCFLVSCSIKPPEITLTGEKTALESQILGSYERLTTNTMVTTSVRAAEPGSAAGSDADNQVLIEAVQSQKFNKDETNELKQDKVIGENNQGFLVVLEHEKYHQDSQFKKFVDSLVEEENRNRRIIYQRVFALNDVEESEDSMYIFAQKQQEQSKPGTMIQNLNGTWIEKE